MQTDLSSLQFQYLEENNNLSLLDNLENFEILKNNPLENEIWTEEEITKFKILYQNTKDFLEKPDDNDQKLEEEIIEIEEKKPVAAEGPQRLIIPPHANQDSEKKIKNPKRRKVKVNIVRDPPRHPQILPQTPFSSY